MNEILLDSIRRTIGGFDVEGSESSATTNARLPQISHPYGQSPGISSLKFPKDYR